MGILYLVIVAIILIGLITYTPVGDFLSKITGGDIGVGLIIYAIGIFVCCVSVWEGICAFFEYIDISIGWK